MEGRNAQPRSYESLLSMAQPTNGFDAFGYISIEVILPMEISESPMLSATKSMEAQRKMAAGRHRCVVGEGGRVGCDPDVDGVLR